jgi:hypothetical protein
MSGLRGWRWVGTDKWWPAILGEPPPILGAVWEPLPYPEPPDSDSTASLRSTNASIPPEAQ